MNHTRTKNKEHARFHIAKELGGIELLDAQYERQTFSRHSHEGYTIGVIERGAQRFYRTGGNHVAPKDSMILVNADEVHTGHSAFEGGWSYRAMYPLPEQLGLAFQASGEQLNYVPYFASPVIHDPELANQFRQVFYALEHSDNLLLRESLVYVSLVRLIQRHARKKPARLSEVKAQRQLLLAKSFLDDFPQENISLQELATMTALTPYHLVRTFQKAYGLPPHAYQVQSRLRLARQWMRQGLSISQAATDAGFHDQSHFYRHFKKWMGITPGQYLQSLRR
ncbi:AraC family transcriptional regulator [Vibrio mangrovi]|uniref:AraC family transcriptional regulator n=1 Tax=Vibrio mangrovi TaxID=474394 RepID=A0A1Y6IZB5_9VIBR|nr:AraC family transcriptional regulator [Vibrio mangrovi]MDW6005064.1 AraC family transcriptional regulator [Vibrio mangrovi]SMS01832.1 Bifunctional transcriptional activator/DNA repair enzyme Ada [Vibrio mangrovi]